MVFKSYNTSWMLHPWNYALDIFLRCTDSNVLIDFNMKKKKSHSIYVWKVLISFNNFQIKVAHFTETSVFG